jgi:uncharacterized protein (DUF3084 family)
MELNFGTVTVILSIVGSLLGIIQQMKSMKKAQEDAIRKQAEQQSSLEARLESLERSVASHNQYAEKFASLTQTIIEMRTDLRWIKDSLDK